MTGARSLNSLSCSSAPASSRPGRTHETRSPLPSCGSPRQTSRRTSDEPLPSPHSTREALRMERCTRRSSSQLACVRLRSVSVARTPQSSHLVLTPVGSHNRTGAGEQCLRHSAEPALHVAEFRLFGRCWKQWRGGGDAGCRRLLRTIFTVAGSHSSLHTNRYRVFGRGRASL